MNTWATFRDGLTITAVGMALVFLSLILIAVVIWALDKMFRAEPQAVVIDEEADLDLPAGPMTPYPPLETDEASNLAAAIAVALALQSRQGAPFLAAAPAGAGLIGAAPMAMAPLPWQVVADVDDEEVTGEVITVTGIAGSAGWKARGRLDGLK